MYGIPEKAEGLEHKPRKIRGELEAALYLELEKQSYLRSTTPYQLTSSIVAAFLRGSLVPRVQPDASASAPHTSPSPSVADPEQAGRGPGAREGTP